MRRSAWLLQTCGPPTLKSKRGGQLAGSDWVLLRAMNRRRVAASWLHLPPVSKATTTRRARPPPMISGYVLSLARRAMWSAAPDVVRWWRHRAMKQGPCSHGAIPRARKNREEVL